MTKSEKRSAHAKSAKKTPKATKPWDVPIFPKHGDIDVQILYATVGHALTRWEAMEERLAHLFSILIGLHDPSEIAERAYGAVVTFRGRKEMIERAADLYFGLFPDATIKSMFDEAMLYAQGFAARRNEIAHGKVTSFLKPDKTLEFLMQPPTYASNKIKWYGDINYLYNSAIINNLAVGFDFTFVRVDRLARAIAARHPRPEFTKSLCHIIASRGTSLLFRSRSR